MLDVDTFLTTLYVTVDDFRHSRPQSEQRPGPNASLSPSEVATLAIFARWSRFTSERDFYRYARSCLRDAFPTLPERSQFNRLVRHSLGLIEEVASHLADVMKAQRCPYQALDSSAMPVRDAKKRRGEGWLAGSADIGWSNRLGWYEGFRLLVAVDPTGGSSRASASVPLPSLTSRQRRPSSRCAMGRTLGSSAWGQPSLRDPTWPTRASRAKGTTGAGSNATGRESSTRPSATAANPGPSA